MKKKPSKKILKFPALTPNLYAPKQWMNHKFTFVQNGEFEPLHMTLDYAMNKVIMVAYKLYIIAGHLNVMASKYKEKLIMKQPL